jgi:hypothetical protein
MELSMEFKSNPVHCSASAAEVLTFLAEPGHLAELLPQDRFTDFAVQPNGCSFKMTGGIPVVLARAEDPPGGVKYTSAKGTPVKFFLVIHAEDTGSASPACTVHVEGEAEVNAFTRMLVEKPLAQVMDALAQALEARFS